MDICNFKIVFDSSADILAIKHVDFASAPLKIITDEKQYVDDRELNVENMINELYEYKGRSSSSCPSPMDWLDSFGDAKYVFCVTLTSKISGSYNSATLAKNDYEESFPDRRVYVIDTLSAGPEVRMMVEKIRELILDGKEFDEICKIAEEYKSETELYFVLESLNNFANNGRVSPSVAKMANMFGIRIIGKAYMGELKPLLKSCGEKKSLAALLERIENAGYKGGKVRIAHCMNEDAAKKVATEIRRKYENSDIKIYHTRGLCSFYAEKGGLLVGFEK